jgi:hypothetical protein
MIALQLIGISIALVAIYMSYLYYRRKDFTKLDFLFWMTIWSVFLIVIITPSSFDFILKTLKIWRMLDMIVIVSLIIIYMLAFNNYAKNKKIQRQIETLIRNHALKPLKDGLDGKEDKPSKIQ